MAAAARACDDYDTALDYLKKSFAIKQEIGDVAGLCTTLFNMGHIYLLKEDVTQAIGTWHGLYQFAKEKKQDKFLNALEALGLPGGLSFFEGLASQAEETGDDQPPVK